jgi:hypothetical protein
MFQHRKQTQLLKERMISQIKQRREEAKTLPPGADRELKLRRAQQAETASYIDQWLQSPGLRRPE